MEHYREIEKTKKYTKLLFQGSWRNNLAPNSMLRRKCKGGKVVKLI